ncbi:MAG: protease HtpX [Betaproteobacteria bacterium]|nr:protease HtpX [Betaproteobacteria bacterium]
MKRIFLFVATNLAVLVVLSIAMKLLGLEQALAGTGFNTGAMLVMAAVLGFGGAFVSLAMSKWIAKRSTEAHVIDVPRDQTERWLFDTVQGQARAAGIGMPEVAIYDAPDVNAFATGMKRDNALVAVSTGLLQRMSREEAEAVLGHEVSHIANGDMVTLTLIQGVVNTFVFFLARVIGYLVDRVILKNERGYGIGYFVTTFVAEMLLGILATIIVLWFSRRREFRADAGGAKLAGREKMIGALQRLQAVHEESTLPAQMKAFGIRGGGTMGRLFMSHPPLEERIEALRGAARPIANEWGR